MPATLSGTGVFDDVRALRPSPALVAYDINAPFWSDGAEKRRWIAVPKDSAIEFAASGPWDFPRGTVLVKHFELPTAGGRARRLETRVLVCLGNREVTGATYRWREDGSDADLVSSGRAEPIGGESDGRTWSLPGPADCRTCHLPAGGGVLGVSTRQLNKPSPGGDVNQLVAWQRAGMLHADAPLDPAALPALVHPQDRRASLERRARAYLDTNCALCHQPGTGIAADFDARSATPLGQAGMLDARARIDLGLDGARIIAPADPSRSVLLSRVADLDGNRMPPIAHERVDAEGVELLKEWIRSLPGVASLDAPGITPAGGDFDGPVTVTLDSKGAGATLRYTLDGSVPRASSPVYQGPFTLDRSTTVRARAFSNESSRRDSVTVQATYIISPPSRPAAARP